MAPVSSRKWSILRHLSHLQQLEVYHRSIKPSSKPRNPETGFLRLPPEIRAKVFRLCILDHLVSADSCSRCNAERLRLSVSGHPEPTVAITASLERVLFAHFAVAVIMLPAVVSIWTLIRYFPTLEGWFVSLWNAWIYLLLFACFGEPIGLLLDWCERYFTWPAHHTTILDSVEGSELLALWVLFRDIVMALPEAMWHCEVKRHKAAKEGHNRSCELWHHTGSIDKLPIFHLNRKLTSEAVAAVEWLRTPLSSWKRPVHHLMRQNLGSIIDRDRRYRFMMVARSQEDKFRVFAMAQTVTLGRRASRRQRRATL